MTALGRTETRGWPAGRGVVSYLVVGVIALAIGVAAAYGIERIGETPGATAAHQTVTERSAGMTTHLSGLWESGLAQRVAIRDQTHIQGRIDSGLAQQQAMASAESSSNAWTMRGRETSNHLDALIRSGLAQQGVARGG